MDRIVAFDTETRLIEPGLLTPELICVSISDGKKTGLFDSMMGPTVIQHLLRDPNVHLVGHNIAYDFGVLAARRPAMLPEIFAAYEAGRIWDTGIRQIVRDIAEGREDINGKLFVVRNGERKPAGYRLANLSEEYLRKDRYAEKNDPSSWRMRYQELIDLPIEEWPAEAQAYAREDAADTYEIFVRQGGVEGAWPTEQDNVRAAWALHLMSAWGMRTDGAKVESLKTKLLEQREHLRVRLKKVGFIVAKRCPESEAEFFEEVVKYRKATKKDLQADIDGTRPKVVEKDGVPHVVTRSKAPARWAKDLTKVAEYVKRYLHRRGKPVPLTESGKVSTAKQTLLDSGSLLLALFAEGGGIDKALEFIPSLEEGINRPINARYNTAVNTSRTSCSTPNWQQMPSGRKVGGIRECVVPRPGYVFCSVDYDTLELRALAQVCLRLFKHSRMADVINQGKDLHSAVGAEMLGITYEEIEKGKKVKGSRAKSARDAAKVFNFGAPGGLGAVSLVDYARAGYGVTITESQAREMKAQWLGAWPEMVQYFDWVNAMVGIGDAQIKHPVTGAVRGNVGYTDGCNHQFQHLAAIGAKKALFAVAKECYVDCDTALYGSRPVAFIHDEIIAELPEEFAHDAATRLAEVMCRSMALVIPDVKIAASPTLMRYWSKDAQDLTDEQGRMIPWPKETS